MLYSNSIDVLVSPACEKDLPVIVQLAKSFDLDCEDLSWEQFIIAKSDDAIVGFGRLRDYPDPENSGAGCTEVATVGVIHEERNKGIGTSIVNKLIQTGPKEIFVTCVIPNFFSRLGFEAVKQYPTVLQKKVDFCKLYDFCDEQIFVMKMVKD